MGKRTHMGRTITKFLLGFIAALTLALPAAAQDITQVPEDFDWSPYINDWDNAWYDDDWDNTNRQNYQDQPVYYDWYGNTYSVNPYQDPTPTPDYSYYGYGEAETSGTWNESQYNGTDWFYQSNTDFDTFGTYGSLPKAASVGEFTGYAQSYNLDCEARSAVDLAAFFGINISHSEFLSRIPLSDDPNEGFVGSYTDERGQIPPNSYGVYQEPIAELLRSYGLPAVGVVGWTRDALKAQIASGKPVMVWVVGSTEVGYSKPYTAPSTGVTTSVAPYQHTVIVIAYDEEGVTVQDGAYQYTRTWGTFDLSWAALNNRAIYVNR